MTPPGLDFCRVGYDDLRWDDFLGKQMHKWLLIAGLILSAVPDASHAQQSVEDFVKEQVLGGRYMSPANGCEPSSIDLFKWPKTELQRCEYSVKDVFSDGTSRTKKAIVYLANPTPEQVLSWLRSACTLARPGTLDACIRKSVLKIRGDSGAQFPIAGLVWEDQACGHPKGKCKKDSDGNEIGDGVQEGYIFRNGVTVRVEGFSNGSTDPVIDDKALTALATEQKVTGVKATGGFARINSTTRKDFQRHTGRKDIPIGKSDKDAALAWSSIVGETYRAALSSDSNPLITAAVCARFKFPKACRPK